MIASSVAGTPRPVTLPGLLLQGVNSCSRYLFGLCGQMGTFIETFTFDTTTGEGWGMTYDSSRHEIIVSDGSSYLHVWDPDTPEEKRKVHVFRQVGTKKSR